MQVGFIGLGTMGGAMAANLQKAGFALTVADLSEARLAPLLEKGARRGGTPRQIAAECDVIFTSLPGPKEVEAVALGENGILAGIRKGAAYFDLSTNARATVIRINEAFAAHGAHMLDAPVSGGPKGAQSGKLAIWVGGERAVFDQHKPVLDGMSDQPRYVGAIGQATVAKLVHNCAGYALSVVLAEVFSMGAKAGLDPLALYEAIRQGATGRKRTFDGIVDQFLPGTYDPPAFALKLAHKDVGLAVQLGRELGVPMRLCNLTFEEMTDAMNRGWAERDSRILMTLQTERAGTPIAIDPARIRAALAADNTEAIEPAKS